MLSAILKHQGLAYEIDFDHPIDISIPVGRTKSPNAFYLQKPEYSTVEAGGFVGDVNRGGSCNVENILFSPHGNGTHTECSGHISNEHHYVNNLLSRHFYLALLITIEPDTNKTDSFISANAIAGAIGSRKIAAEALVIRTKPNASNKRAINYGGTNPAYFSLDAMMLIKNELQIKHLLTDLPSVDKEDDNKLTAHHLFFDNENKEDMPKTITEMIYAADEIPDGLYWLDLQIAGFESDASPSKPILYKTRLIQ